MIITLLSLFLTGLFPLDSAQFIHPSEMLGQCESLVNQGEHEKAITLYLQINENDTSYYQAQVALMAAYNALQMYNESIAIGNKMKDLPGNQKLDIFINLGNAFIDKGEAVKGLEIYSEGLSLFPYSHILLYNMGLANYRLQNYPEALKYYQKSVRINPFYGNNHIMLGYLSVLQGHATKAILSYLTYLAIHPDKNGTLVFLENFASEAVRAEGSVPAFNDNKDFVYMDAIIKSKAALDERFKSNVEFNATIVKQTELLLTKLDFDPNSNDFWMQFYVPFFKSLATQNLKEAFIYFILQSTGNDHVTAWLSGHEKEKSAWIDVANDVFTNYRINNETEILDEKGIFSFWFNSSNELNAIGNERSGEVRYGPWAFFHDNGQLSAIGRYTESGEKSGKWLYYHKNGRKSLEEFFDAKGKFTKPAMYFHENGELSIIVRYNSENELHGDLEYYYPCGQLKEVIPYQNGVVTGLVKSYYESGTLMNLYEVKKDLLDGDYSHFYQNGAVNKKYSNQSDMANGRFESYFLNKQMEEGGNYSQDNLDGDWLGFHENGNPRYKGSFLMGKNVGKWEFFHSNGTLKEVIHYNNDGEKHGKNPVYTYEGKLHRTIEYNQDKVVGISHHNEEGVNINEWRDEGGNMEFQSYFPDGRLMSSGSYVNGKIEGFFNAFHPNGNIRYQVNVVEDLFEGPYEEFHSNGKIYIKCSFEKGIKSGRHTEFYKNGQIEEDGWYVNDLREQWWYVYNPDGTLKEKTYYIAGKINGWDTTFGPNNRPVYAIKYESDRISELRQYDSLGNIYHHCLFPNGNGMHARISVSGDTIYKATLYCGQLNSDIQTFYANYKLKTSDPVINTFLEGTHTSYRSDGSIRVKGNYSNNEMHGTWEWYYPDERTLLRKDYFFGRGVGPSVFYYYNGAIESECTFADGELDGVCKFFDHLGNLQLVKIYKKEIGPVAYVDTKSGDTIQFVNNETFVLRSYFPNGKLSVEQNYLDGNLHGETTWYNSDGTLIEKNQYVHGEQHGESTRYFTNGKRNVQTRYAFDQKHGKETEFYENGKIHRITSYLNGSMSGYDVLFDTQGKIKSKIFYWNDEVY